MQFYGFPLLVLVCLACQANSSPVVDMTISIDGADDGHVDIGPDVGVNVDIDDVSSNDVDGDEFESDAVFDRAGGFSDDVVTGSDFELGNDVEFGGDVSDDVDLTAARLCENIGEADDEDCLNKRNKSKRKKRKRKDPPKIAFSAYLNKEFKAESGNNVVKFDTMFEQCDKKGACYNNATGMFKAPITGVYQFTFVISQATTGVSRAHLVRKAGSQAITIVDAIAEGTSGGIRVQGTNTAIIKLLATNEVYVEMDAGAALDGDRYTTFSGHLLYLW